MKIKFEDFINEYYSSYRFGDNDDKEVIDGDNKFLRRINDQTKTNIKETILYKWMKAKSIPYLDYISVVNNIYNLELDFNQSFEKSDDVLVQKLQRFWVEFNYDPMEFFKFKTKLIQAINKK